MNESPTAERDYDIIHLASDEWDNGTMQRVATEYFAANPLCNFVFVHEHGGWWLGYRRDLSIWCTANDMAVLTQRFPRPRAYSGRETRRTPKVVPFKQPEVPSELELKKAIV